MKTLVLTAVACLGLTAQSFGTIIYVNAQATGTNDGSSWTNAFTNLSQAIVEATNNTANVDSLFVAGGVYIPDVDQNLGYPVFNCPPQIELFGGFPSSGNPTFADRDWEANPTILEGDVQGDDDGTVNTRSDNAKRVLAFDTYGRLDGFVVRNGGDNNGGGGSGLSMLGATSRNALVENCLFENNWVTNAGALTGEGGAIRGASVNATDVLELRNVVLRNNKAKFGGGLIYSGTLASNNCVFIGNEAELGSGIALGGSSNGSGTGTIIQNVFYNHQTLGGVNQGDRSGVIARLNSGRGELRVWNSTFKDNQADSVSTVYGGLPLFVGTYTEFNNCLMDETDNLPAIALYENDTVVFNNCVGSFSSGWPATGDVTINDGQLELSNWQEGSPIAYLVENSTDGIFVLDCDAPGHEDGLNSLLPGSLANGTDLLGNTRIQGSSVDVGAFETAAYDQPQIEQQNNTLQVINGPYDSYQWLQDGMPISGANDPTFDLTENGDYMLVAQVNDACGHDTSMVVQVTNQDTMGTGINEQALLEVRFWPNPANDFVQLESRQQPIQHVRLFTTSGQQLTLQLDATQRIQIGHLPRGVYFIEIQLEAGRSVHQLVKL